MKEVVDSQTVNERMGELRRAAKILEEYAKPIYSITGGDPSFDQITRIHWAKDQFKTAEQAMLVLAEVGETQGKKLTITDEQKRNFRGISIHVRGKLYPRYTKAESFVIDKGRVSVDEKKVRKMLEEKHTVVVDDESDTFNGWMATFTTLVNQCPDPGVKRRLGKFAIQTGIALKGAKVEVKDGDLQVIEG
ncbi:MAG: hypothetical protein R6U58_08305 [Bacteroidales bacterium]